MASVSTQCLCMVCGISVESVDIRAHCGSQPHIDKCNRKYRDPRDRALRGGGGSGAHNKPYHNPETPSSSTTAMGIRKISQPQSSSASTNTPALDLNSTAPQDLRTRASTSPPLPIFPPAVPQGCFCTPCNTRVQFSAIREHLKSTEHTARCLSDAYHFTASNHLSLHPPVSFEQVVSYKKLEDG